MILKTNHTAQRMTTWLLLIAMIAAPVSSLAQGTRISPPKNSYSPADDVKLGTQAAAEVERQMPTLPEDSSVDAYVERVGQRLVAAIPPEFHHPEFRYQFDVVNARDINAFALPGGPMYVNRGMLEAARNEGEMAGVMAHEISHVALRHGTAQATKQQSAKVQLGAIGGAILGAIIGGNVGGAIAQGTQLGLGAYLLKFSREYETQADVLGAQIMARAGYDPRDLANMFRTIEQQSGGSGAPEWLSSHPNPGNRYERINQEAGKLRIERSRGGQDTAAFSSAQSELRRMSPAPTMQEIASKGQSNPQGGQSYPEDAKIASRVENPSPNYRAYTGGNLFRLSIPDNWREFASNNSVTFAPEGAYGNYRGQSVFTHGAIVGVVDAGTNDLRQASDRYISGLLQGNSYLSPQGNYRRASVAGRSGLSMVLAGTSNVTGRDEVVVVYTTMLRNGALFYVINVAPRDQYRRYERAFQNVLRSVQING
jgi:Zn-dependent protease with chaperone function